MVKGVYCGKNRKNISFDECTKCANCFASLIINSLRDDNHHKKTHNSYSVGEIIGCLRKAYYNRKEPIDEYSSLKSLIRAKNGKNLEGFVDSAQHKEEDGIKEFEVDKEKVKLCGRYDAYDSDKFEIVEIKSKLLYKDIELPIEKDVDQLQCYFTIFKDILIVKKLSLAYFDIDQGVQCDVQLVDKTPWIQERLNTLHRALRDTRPPREEQKCCNDCVYKNRCRVIPINSYRISQNKSKNANWESNFYGL